MSRPYRAIIALRKVTGRHPYTVFAGGPGQASDLHCTLRSRVRRGCSRGFQQRWSPCAGAHCQAEASCVWGQLTPGPLQGRQAVKQAGQTDRAHTHAHRCTHVTLGESQIRRCPPPYVTPPHRPRDGMPLLPARALGGVDGGLGRGQGRGPLSRIKEGLLLNRRPDYPGRSVAGRSRPPLAPACPTTACPRQGPRPCRPDRLGLVVQAPPAIFSRRLLGLLYKVLNLKQQTCWVFGGMFVLPTDGDRGHGLHRAVRVGPISRGLCSGTARTVCLSVCPAGRPGPGCRYLIRAPITAATG